MGNGQGGPGTGTSAISLGLEKDDIHMGAQKAMFTLLVSFYEDSRKTFHLLQNGVAIVLLKRKPNCLSYGLKESHN